jgi:DNA adenine methylase
MAKYHPQIYKEKLTHCLMAPAKPFIKWAGGKRQLIQHLLAKTPEKFETYHEFFLGGGALFFELYNQGRIKDAILSDLNPRLMNAYEVVKRKPTELIEELKNKKYANQKEAFYKIREWEPIDSIERAARFIYLNKTAFNGLYRENLSGKFNVPFGKYKNPKIVDIESIQNASEALQKAKLLCGDFSEILRNAKRDDFAYFDPPYLPITKTANFTGYTAQSFGIDEQIRLKETFSILAKRGVKVLLSNSHTPLIDDLFSDSEKSTIKANRMINCKSDRRGPINELLIHQGY